MAFVNLLMQDMSKIVLSNKEGPSGGRTGEIHKREARPNCCLEMPAVSRCQAATRGGREPNGLNCFVVGTLWEDYSD